MRFAGDAASAGQRWRETLLEASRVVAHALSGGLLFRAHVGERQRPTVKLVRGVWALLAGVLVWSWGLRAAVVAGALGSAALVLGALAALAALVWVGELVAPSLAARCLNGEAKP
jgi:hypothetical protein